MANNYCQLSCVLAIPQGSSGRAEEICSRVAQELESEDGFLGAVYEVGDTGVWFHHDENADAEHVAELARALVEELEIDEPFFCSWAYTCSKPRVDEFGGGAFVVKRGYPTVWVDVMNHVMKVERETMR
jgi:hypothetical protein